PTATSPLSLHDALPIYTHSRILQPTTMMASKSPAADPQAAQRVLFLAVGDYLDRSQMMLIELANANPKASLDISSEQERAENLIDRKSTRLNSSHVSIS